MKSNFSGIESDEIFAQDQYHELAPRALDMDQFLLISQGHAAFQFMNAGVELGLYNYLSQKPNSDLNQIALALNLDSIPCRILMTGLASLGLVIKMGVGYKNSSIANRMLVDIDNPQSFAPVLGWQKDIVYPGLADFVQSLRENRNVGLQRFPGDANAVNLYERIASDPDPKKKLENTFQKAMSALSKQAHSTLVNTADFSKYGHLVDVGGGNGTNAIAIARKFPNLKITIFDSPTVCEIAAKNIFEAGLKKQINVQAGNIFEDPLPEGIDAILYAHMFTIWSPDSNLQILKKSYSALPTNGSVFIFNMMGNESHTGPVSTALGAAYFLAIATGKGNLYAWDEYSNWICQAGFKKTKRLKNLNLDHGIFIATK